MAIRVITVSGTVTVRDHTAKHELYLLSGRRRYGATNLDVVSNMKKFVHDDIAANLFPALAYQAFSQGFSKVRSTTRQAILKSAVLVDLELHENSAIAHNQRADTVAYCSFRGDLCHFDFGTRPCV